MDALLLSRIQFAWVVAFHILLPAFTVGLACYVATLEVRYWIGKDEKIRRLSAFWIKIFAISFGMGVVSGIVMPFQFGTNWSRFIDAASNVVGSLLAYEVVTAFYLEAAFLGVLLFGRKLVPQWAHALSAVAVAAGTVLSSFWILAVNSWMHTPDGFEIVDGRFMPTSMLDIIFTPSFPYRLTHTVSAFLITTAFVILAVGASYLRHGRSPEESRIMVRMSLLFLTLMVPVQVLLGDLHGLNTLEHQPAKVAAMEGLWETERGVAASLFAIPDEEAERNHYEIAIPKLASLYLTHDIDGEVKGLKEWPREDRPPVAIVYFAFRIMVGIAFLMLFTVIAGLVLWRRGRLYDTRWYLRWCSWMGASGFIAVLAGWTTTEVGRQPWVVYGVMRTADAVTPSLTTMDVAVSLTSYVVAYIVIFGGGFILLRRLVRIGVQPAAESEDRESPPEETAHRPKRPLSAVVESQLGGRKA
ncbi:cytochrome ubiquinol oxidase subunit I [Noviherbaspirillum aridicola]|uniref:Cytochrome ubiquinol oxidase subunit I n=1 Tax=Noviherbaspirillum aridicola TaxID=2849687 RepID=A0ABQ4Q0D4_9BURK|nr:cytochrome ubiquinol oxidase subunit I [Noviherbaspirillum aridicola]GIZ50452.1 cytochrome ubiquinol oxidase subunit I [Noviherbaspirillum aridicola]